MKNKFVISFVAISAIFLLVMPASVFAKVLIFDQPTDTLKSWLKGEEYDILLPKEVESLYGQKISQIDIADLHFFDKYDAVYISDGVYNELNTPDSITTIITRDPLKTEISARSDTGIVSQRTKVKLQRVYCQGLPFYGYSKDQIAIVTYGDTKTKKSKLYETGINHPRDLVFYKIIDEKCSGLPIWEICWENVQRR